MNKNINKTLLTFLILLFLFFPKSIDWGQCQEIQMKERIISAFSGKIPKEWGERVIHYSHAHELPWRRDSRRFDGSHSRIKKEGI